MLKLQYLSLDEISWLIGKDPDAGKDWRQEKGAEDEMVGWHHWLSGHELGQTSGGGETGKPGMLQSSWSQRVRHSLVIEQQQHIYKGLLLSHKTHEVAPFAEIWVDLETVTESEVRSEREKQISYVNTYMWNLEKWYSWTYMQSRNRETKLWTPRAVGERG